MHFYKVFVCLTQKNLITQCLFEDLTFTIQATNQTLFESGKKIKTSPNLSVINGQNSNEYTHHVHLRHLTYS